MSPHRVMTSGLALGLRAIRRYFLRRQHVARERLKWAECGCWNLGIDGRVTVNLLCRARVFAVKCDLGDWGLPVGSPRDRCEAEWSICQASFAVLLGAPRVLPGTIKSPFTNSPSASSGLSPMRGVSQWLKQLRRS